MTNPKRLTPASIPSNALADVVNAPHCGVLVSYLLSRFR